MHAVAISPGRRGKGCVSELLKCKGLCNTPEYGDSSHFCTLFLGACLDRARFFFLFAVHEPRKGQPSETGRDYCINNSSTVVAAL